jgi:hypothetical protein
LTEITALPGAGCNPPGEESPPDDGVPAGVPPFEEGEPPLEEGEPPPEEGEPPSFVVSDSCCANGSLLSNRLNDSSCPFCSGGGTSPLANDPGPPLEVATAG